MDREKEIETERETLGKGWGWYGFTTTEKSNHPSGGGFKKLLEIILHYGKWGRLCVTLKRSSNIITFMSSTERSLAGIGLRKKGGQVGQGRAG